MEATHDVIDIRPAENSEPSPQKHFRFTLNRIDQLKFADAGQTFYWDTDQPGFFLRVTKSAKSFGVEKKVQGKTCRITIGKFPNLSLNVARQDAREKLLSMSRGISPRQEAIQSAIKEMTLEQVFEDFMATRHLKEYTQYDYRKAFDWAFTPWKNRRFIDITKADVISSHQSLGLRSQARANCSMRILRVMFNFAMAKYDDQYGEPVIKSNPAQALSRLKLWFRIDKRKTLIKSHDMPKWFESVLKLADPSQTEFSKTVRDYLLFVLFTGLRRNEAAKLKWVNVDLRSMLFTVPDTKNREDHCLPIPSVLQPMFLRRFENKVGDCVFNGEGAHGHLVSLEKRVAKVRDASGVEFMIHDLRRTFITTAESVDIPHYALKMLLNHKRGGDVTAGYIIPSPERLRGPIEKVATSILEKARISPGDLT